MTYDVRSGLPRSGYTYFIVILGEYPMGSRVEILCVLFRLIYAADNVLYSYSSLSTYGSCSAGLLHPRVVYCALGNTEEYLFYLLL